MTDQDRISSNNIIFIIKQKSEANEEKYRLGEYLLIPTQIIPTNITRMVWETARRITHEILGLRGVTT